MTSKELANALLDAIKRRYNYTTDADLARHFQRSPMQIRRWRNGHLPLAFKMLTPYVIECADDLYQVTSDK